MRMREIRLNDGRRYIERYLAFDLCGYRAYLHRYLAADGDRYVHDHPWPWCVGIPLVGWYDETRLRSLPSQDCPAFTQCRRIRVGSLNFMGAMSFHRIDRVGIGTWTLFVHGPRFKGWGFLEMDSGQVSFRRAASSITRENAGWTKTAPRAYQVRID